jgi:hypothetical protein
MGAARRGFGTGTLEMDQHKINDSRIA